MASMDRSLCLGSATGTFKLNQYPAVGMYCENEEAAAKLDATPGYFSILSIQVPFAVRMSTTE
jgi:hypothetical protein